MAVLAPICAQLNRHWLAWRNSALCKRLAQLTKSCLETKPVPSCFLPWANRQRSCS